MKYFLLFLSLLAYGLVNAQIKGVVVDRTNKSAIIGASVYWQLAKKGTQTNESGIFEIVLPASLPDYLIITYPGYENDTLINLTATQEVLVKLNPTVKLNEAEVKENATGLAFNFVSPLHKQTLSQTELKKAACCNLSESFETNATVDVSYTDAVSGSKQIKILGLDGAYTQMLTEQNIGARGLNTNFGLNHIPGTWVKAIDITKGVGSVVNGYEGIAGQINVELEKPQQMPALFVNVYAGDLGRFEANVQLAKKINAKWSTGLLTHGNTILLKNDFNKDGYLDAPLGHQFNVINRWKYENTGKLMADFGVQALTEEKNGGQVAYQTKTENDLQVNYGVQIKINKLEANSKLAFGKPGKPYESFGVVTSLRAYQHQSFMGIKAYNGKEQTIYTNLIYQNIIGTTEHTYKTGLSFLGDYYQENYFDNRFSDSAFNREENITGAFIEYHYKHISKGDILIGYRTDYHSMFGLLHNPRIHAKLNVFKTATIKFSAGRGMRVANVFIENAATMASNRIVKVTESLTPEIARNLGISYTHFFKINQQKINFTADFFRTDFENQTVVDLDASPQYVLVYNLKGKSYSNTAQIELKYEPFKQFELRGAYKFQDAKTTYTSQLLARPFVAKHKLLFNAAYATKFDKWKFDATLKWFGTQRLPSTQTNPQNLVWSNEAKPYYTINTQITRAFKKWEWYVGAENILDVVQQNQIIDKDNPFGNYFDASLIWGPVMGRVIYTGIRLTIK